MMADYIDGMIEEFNGFIFDRCWYFASNAYSYILAKKAREIRRGYLIIHIPGSIKCQVVDVYGGKAYRHNTSRLVEHADMITCYEVKDLESFLNRERICKAS